MSTESILNKTLDLDDLTGPAIHPTVTSLRHWVWGWLFRGQRLAVNGHVKRRAYIRQHKMWEYARGLALTEASEPTRPGRAPMKVLDVGGAMTAPIFYLAALGDSVLSLDIDDRLVAETNDIATRRGLNLQARTTNLATGSAAPQDLGAPGGFDRIYCFCVLEHIPEPGQTAIAKRLGELLAPGGQMCLTFDFGEDAPTEQPMYSHEHVAHLRDAVGVPLRGNDSFRDDQRRFPLDRKYPKRAYTFGSLFFRKPDAS